MEKPRVVITKNTVDIDDRLKECFEIKEYHIRTPTYMFYHSKHFFNADSILPSNLSFIRDLAFCYLSANGFKVSYTEGVIELIGHNMNTPYTIEEPITFRMDDFSSFSKNVETCVFYIRREDSVYGGNFFFRDGHETKRIITVENLVMLYNGHLEYDIDLVFGFGVRQCIVVQFPSIYRNL